MKTYKNVNDYIKGNTGYSIVELEKSEKINYTIPLLNKVKDMIMNAIKENVPITVVGDYDTDGITALGIFCFILMYLHADYHIIIPKRIEEGYGIGHAIVERIIPGLLITVDNGIAASEALKEAKDKGCKIIVMDHHLATDNIPDVDVLVDPTAFPEQATYSKYCGAGLAYKLAELIIHDRKLMNYASCLAAIGTIGDCVELLGDNRKIVKEGLLHLENRECTLGLKLLMDKFGILHVDSETIGYKLSPCINASGRLEDEGGKLSLSTIMYNGLLNEKAIGYVETLYQKNEERKELVASISNTIMIDETKNAIVSIQDDATEGIIGLLAGKIAENTQKPTFILTETKDGILKGSSRSKDDNNNLKEMLDKVAPLLLRYGGHKKAAGFSLLKKNFDEFKRTLEEIAIPVKITEQEFDLELVPNQIKEVMFDLDRAKPFGIGNEAPIFLFNAHLIENSYKKTYYTTMGKENEHLKMFCENDISAVAFNMMDQYQKMNCPQDVNLIGRLQYNVYLNKNTNKECKTIQMLVSDLK